MQSRRQLTKVISLMVLVVMGCLAEESHSNIEFDKLKPHIEIEQREELKIDCIITLKESPSILVKWTFVPKDNVSEDKPEEWVIAVDGKILKHHTDRINDDKYSTKKRPYMDFVSDHSMEEHSLKVKDVRFADQGAYYCQVTIQV
jgi:hypothetical protein